MYPDEFVILENWLCENHLTRLGCENRLMGYENSDALFVVYLTSGQILVKTPIFSKAYGILMGNQGNS